MSPIIIVQPGQQAPGERLNNKISISSPGQQTQVIQSEKPLELHFPQPQPGSMVSIMALSQTIEADCNRGKVIIK